jgi:iron complex outermembrane recepter protein
MTRTSSRLRSAASSRVLLLTGVLSAAMAWGSAAAAQDEVEEIVVTGFRASLEKALAEKRDATGVVDTILAEDIAKFPDNNLAESIQRIPGVAITRDGGEGKNISVRGLGPDFTRVRINGMEAQAVTDGVGGVTRGRGFDFNIFASELFSRIDVHKTASANLEEGSLGATVDLHTGRPLDYGKFVLAGSLKGSFSEISGKTDPRAAFLISNTWGEDRFGALFSIAYSESTRTLVGSNTGFWDVGTSNGGFCPPGLARCAGSNVAAYNTANAVTSWHPRFLRYWQDTLDQERLGMTGALQWKPTDKTLVSLDVLFSRLKGIHTQPTIEAIGFSRAASQGGKPETIVRDAAVDPQGFLVYGLFDNVDIRSEDIYDKYQTDFLQWSLTASHQITERLSVDALVGYSSSDQDNAEDLVFQIDHFNADGYSWDMRQTGYTRPAINYGFDVTDPNQFYLGPTCTTLGQPGCANPVAGGTGPTGPEIRARPNWGDNKHKTGQVTLKYETDWGVNLLAGVQLKTYSFYSRGERILRGEANTPAIPAGSTIASLTELFCFDNDLELGGSTPRCFIKPNGQAITNAYNVLNAPPGSRYETSETVSSARGDNRKVEEEDTGAFIQATFDTEFAGMPVRGDIGVRYVETKQKSEFYTTVPVAVDPAGVVRTTVERKYDDTLPSLNLSVEPMEDVLIRLGLAKVMSRPGLAALATATNVGVAGGSRTVTSGNPNLEPFRAKTLDLSAEWYFMPGGLISIGYFYKDISTYIQTVSTQAPYSSTGLPDSLLTGTGATASDTFTISTVINTPGGPLKGFEINYQQPLSFLPAPFDGFGILANYTHVESEITYYLTSNPATGSVKNSLINLSPDAFNFTLYYEKGPFQARVSANYRDAYLSAVPGRSNTPTAVPPIVVDANGVPSSTYVDFSSSYEINDRFTVSLEAINLTDETEQTWQDSTAQRFEVYRKPGRQFYVGVRYSF